VHLFNKKKPLTFLFILAAIKIKPMKTILYSSLLLIAVTLSSCGSLGFTKRKYRKGYHWDIAKNASATDKKEARPTTGEKRKIATSTPLYEETPAVAVIEKSSPAITKTSKPTPEKEKTNTSDNKTYFHSNTAKKEVHPSEVTVSAKKEDHQASENKISKPLPAKLSTYASKKGGDVNKALLVICCIFLPPLAVYLFQDDINTDFWVDLLLTLLLFWIFGMIFAFMVCFAGVSLN
jgi:uncharacterized membrane protein YqaE (UPF0057 family)